MSLVDDTIVAPASALVTQAVGIVRISGPASFEIARKIILPSKLPQPGSFSFRKIIDPNTNEIIDTGITLVFKAPHSFTGEDSVEIQVHGSPMILQKITTLIISLGARMADPGEFSFRAFMNGKATIPELELGNAITHLSTAQNVTSMKKAIRAIRVELQKIITKIEANISYFEESTDTSIDRDVASLQKIITKTIESSAPPGLPQVVIAGPPNAGKSTLFNHLIGFERTVVSKKAGTTRDYVKAKISILGNNIELIDGPGLDLVNPDSGQELVKELLKTADIILWLDPNSNLIKKQKNMIFFTSKCDSNSEVSEDWNKLSVKKNIGLDELKSKISKHLPVYEYATSKRQLDILNKLLKHIISAKNASSIDMKAFDLNDALKLISELDGMNCSQETIKQIFGTFCIGK
jgi:tRNA modification GTPase